jgi:hypothetical protein
MSQPSKKIQYLNKDFDALKQRMIEFAETYYPDTYTDFNEASPGLMLMEMASYVGDVLNFYTENQIQENFLQYAKQRNNLLTLAYNYGYNPKVTRASTVSVDVYQVVPSTDAQGFIEPNFNYALQIEEGAQIRSQDQTDIYFYLNSNIDFTLSGSYDPTDVSVYSVDDDNLPSFYLLKKSVMASAGKVVNQEFEFGLAERFNTVNISNSNIIRIIKVTDSEDTRWYEVPYLAQESIFDEVDNIATNDPNLSQYNSTVPYLLKIKKVPQRFISRFRDDNTLELQFGPGVSSNPDEVIIPNPDEVGLGLPYGQDKLTTAWDPSNFQYTQTYGLAPANTTLNVEYVIGGGASSNIPSNTLNTFHTGSIAIYGNNLNPTIASAVVDSLAFNNPGPASGGGAGDTNEQIRQNALSAYPTQLRTVTREDYIIRCYSLPSRYGKISKAYIVPEDNIKPNFRNDNIFSQNFSNMSLYILSEQQDGTLSVSNNALKQNLETFLSEYRMLTDAVNIKDAFIINIGVNFEIIPRPNFSTTATINLCLQELKKYFNRDSWQINQPIFIRDIYTLLDKVEGVQTVESVEFINKVNGEYSPFAYDMDGATIKQIIYPSLDPSIFEVKFPDLDLQGRITTL